MFLCLSRVDTCHQCASMYPDFSQEHLFVLSNKPQILYTSYLRSWQTVREASGKFKCLLLKTVKFSGSSPSKSPLFRVIAMLVITFSGTIPSSTRTRESWCGRTCGLQLVQEVEEVKVSAEVAKMFHSQVRTMVLEFSHSTYIKRGHFWGKCCYIFHRAWGIFRCFAIWDPHEIDGNILYRRKCS